jgi:type IV secretory pathway VirB3-like protein
MSPVIGVPILSNIYILYIYVYLIYVYLIYVYILYIHVYIYMFAHVKIIIITEKEVMSLRRTWESRRDRTL